MEVATALKRRKKMAEGAASSKGRQLAMEEARSDRNDAEEWPQRLVKPMSSQHWRRTAVGQKNDEEQ